MDDSFNDFTRKFDFKVRDNSIADYKNPHCYTRVCEGSLLTKIE